MDIVEIVITAKNLTGPAFAQTKAGLTGVQSAMAKLHKTALLATGAVVAIGVEAVKMASRFDSEMTLLHTQAGVATEKIAGLKKGVLDLAGQVGQNPDSLAESLFHVESNFESMGISSKKALDLVKTAAKGATTGHADLVDVTNALTAAVASGIPGVQNFDQAMGVLNATVGVGDMKMQDLASAFGSGMVATVKGFGLSITDVGAALAVFGDNNIRGALAGNQLRMSVMALANPIKGSGDALQKLGLEQDTLAKDMQKGGLKLALEDLVARMHKAGISSKEQGQIITEAFGRKAGAGLNVLVSQMDRLESKYPALEKGAKGFGAAWADTQKTFAFQTKALQASFDALMITLGEKLIPYVQRMVSFLLAHKQATIAAAEATAGLLAATIALSAALKTAAAVQALWAAGGKAVRALGAAYETVALKILYMRDASAAAGGGLAGLRAAFASLGTTAKLAVGATGIGLLVIALTQLMDVGKTAPPNIERLTTSLGQLGRTGSVSGELGKFGANLEALGRVVDRAAGGGSSYDKFNDTMNKIFSLGHYNSRTFDQATAAIDSIDKGLASMVQNGHADLAAAALKHLTDAMSKHGKDPKELVKQLDDYNAALAGTKLEQQLAAESQGVFGQQAQATTAKLDAQTASAEGLQKAIQALNDVQRGDLDAQAAFEAAIDAATQALKDNGRALHERHGKLDLTTKGARAEEGALTDLAAKTDAATQAAVKNGESWGAVMQTWTRGRDKLIKTAEAMGLTEQQAKALANRILKMPDKTTRLNLNTQDLQKNLADAVARLAKARGKTLVLKGNNADLLQKVINAQNAINGIHGKSVVITYKGVYQGVKNPNGTYTSSTGFTYAHGGIVSAAATGGARGGTVLVGEQGPEYVRLPYGSTVIPAGTTRRMRQQEIQAERDAGRGALGDFGISHFGQMAGWRRNPFEKAIGSPGDLGSLVGALNQWRSTIQKATHGVAEHRLLRDLDVAGRALLKNERAYERVNAALDKAKEKLSSLKDAFGQLKDSVASGIAAFGNITKTAGPSGHMTVTSIRDNLYDAQVKAKTFASDLAALKKKGLSADLLAQIAQAGIEGGGLETATALLSASSGNIKDLNSMQAQIKKAAAAAGTTTADAMYGGGIKAAEGVVKGLEKQKHALERAMESIAKALERAIRKAMEAAARESPKHGRKATGGIVGAAGGGPRSALTWVGEMGPELVNLPYGATVHTAGDSRRMAASGSWGGGNQPLVIQVHFGGMNVGDVLIDPIRKSIRTRGGNVQAVLGWSA